MKRNADEMAEYKLITPQSGNKSQRLIKVLRLVGPWLAWQGWRKLEKLNKVIREWCHSEDAAIGSLVLWQELTMSQYEMATQVDMRVYNALNFENPIPFLGCIRTYHDHDDALEGTTTLYQSLLELSDLEKKIVGNASCTGRCVRSDPLRVKGVESDQWLLIDCSDLEETNCIPPYFHLKFAVPKGLKIVLIDTKIYPFNDPCGYKQETYVAVGRAAALGLSGLVVYNYDPIVVVKVLESFVSTLQEQKEGEFQSPLEILSLPYLGRRLGNKKVYNTAVRDGCVLPSLINEFVLGKLRNLKYLNLDYVDTKGKAEKFGLREVVLHACPNLQVLEQGWYSKYEYLQNIKLPDNVCGPHNCIDFGFVDPFTSWKDPHVIGIYGRNYSPKRTLATFLETNSFSSLGVLICTEPMADKEMVGALAINCPALRFLQIDYSDLYRWYADWHELLKRLFVLILNVPCMRAVLEQYPFCFFPKDCELRVLTMKGGNGSELLLWLEELLNIIDVCLPKLLLLNVIFDRYNDGSLSEIAGFRGNLEHHFRQKSIDLRFAYQSKKRWITLL